MKQKVSRRRFLGGAGMLAGLVIAREMPALAQGNKSGLPGYPFTLGVASGDPLPDGVVLWTRLAPDPLSGGWRSVRSLAVQWEVARDPEMRQIVQRGATLAVPEMAHSVHVELSGLEPSREYWYRFRTDGFVSPIGRTKTAPAFGAPVNQLRFGFVSCSDWQNGQFAAYRRLSEEDLDFVVHLGDYLYEYGPAFSALAGRLHTTPEAGFAATQLTTLADYRNRHALYKTDGALQAAHAAAPWIVTWDDHEVENNYANDIDEELTTLPAVFLLQRAAAYQAYYEHMPLRRSSLPMGPDLLLYRQLVFGNLAAINVLDTRQYRTDQPQDDGFDPILPPGGNPAGTLLGDTQEEWLLANLDRSSARWNILAQQVMMAQFSFAATVPGGPGLYNMDQWDGYGAARQRLLDFVAPRTGKNVVVLTGDIHSSWAHDLKQDFANAASPTVATEFICTSVSASFPPGSVAPVARAAAASPWTKFFEGALRGYSVCTLTPQLWRTDFRAVQTSAQGQVVDANAAVTTLASFGVENGVPGAQRL